MNNMYIFGASGFSREVADICLELGCSNITFIDNYPTDVTYFDFPVISEEEVEKIDLENAYFAIGIGETSIREKIYNKFPHLMYPNIIHPSATFGYKMRDFIENTRGNIITAGVRITNNIVIGDFGIYNLNVSIGHDCIINNFVTISPGANVSGNVNIEKKAYIGTGSTILQGRSIGEKIIIGENSIVGAGAVVVKSVPPNVVVKGIPAK